MANTKITAANIDSTSTGITFADLTVNGDITGTLATAAQPNITSLGTLTGLNVAGTPTFDGLTVDGTGSFTQSSNAATALTTFTNSNAGASARASISFASDTGSSVVGTVSSGWTVDALNANETFMYGSNGVSLFAPASQNVRILAGGSERLRVDSSGSVLIGTTSSSGSSVKLEAHDATNPIIQVKDTTSNIICGIQAGNSEAVIRCPQDSPLVFNVGASETERMRISTTDITLKPSNGTVIVDGGTGDYEPAKVELQGRAFGGDITAKYEVSDGGAVFFGSTTNHSVRFIANNAEKMRIDSSGLVSIGTTSAHDANALLTLSKSAVASSVLKSTTNTVTFANVANGSLSAAYSGTATNHPYYFMTNAIERMRILSDGDVCIGKSSNDINTTGWHVIASGTYAGSVYSGITGAVASTTYHLRDTTNNTWKFYVTNAGVINATSTSITSLSDERLKENIVDLETGLDEVMALKPRRFDWKEGEGSGAKNVAGFIAQEVETVLPDLIDDFMHDDLEDAKSVKMSDMIPTLVKAIQEQQTIIDNLKTRIEALEG